VYLELNQIDLDLAVYQSWVLYLDLAVYLDSNQIDLDLAVYPSWV